MWRIKFLSADYFQISLKFFNFFIHNFFNVLTHKLPINVFIFINRQRNFIVFDSIPTSLIHLIMNIFYGFIQCTSKIQTFFNTLNSTVYSFNRISVLKNSKICRLIKYNSWICPVCRNTDAIFNNHRTIWRFGETCQAFRLLIPAVKKGFGNKCRSLLAFLKN